MPGNIELVINGKDNTGGAFESASGGLASIGNVAMGILTSQVFTQLAAKAAEFLGSIVSKARDAQVAEAQTNAVLKSTGDVSGVTAEEVKKYADAIAGSSKFTDDQVQSGENMLLTFTNIGQDVFPQATQTIADMSAALGQDMTASAMQLGKALNDPIKGVTALRRVGVQLTDEQEKQVKAFMAAGDAASAQKLILGELGREFGGSAKAQANSWDMLSHKFDAVKEKLGNSLLPAIDKVGDVLGKVLDSPAVQAFLDKVVGFVSQNAPKLIDAVLDLGNAFNIMQDPVGGVINMLYRFDGISPIFDDVGETTANFGQLLDKLGAWWNRNSPAIIAQATRIGASLKTALEQISAKLTPFIDKELKKFESWFAENGPLITKVVTKIANDFTTAIPFVVSFFDVVMPLLEGAIDLVLNVATVYMQVFTGDMPGAWETAKQGAIDLGKSITKTFTAFVNWIMSFFGSNLKTVSAQWSSFFNGISMLSSQWWTGLTNSWSNGWNNLVLGVRSSINNVITTISTSLATLQAKINSIITAVRTGVTSMLTTVATAISTAVTTWVNTIINRATNFLNAGKTIISNLLTGVANTIGGIYTNISNAAASWLSVIIGNVQQWINAGATMLNNVGAGISSAATTVYNGLVGIAATWIAVISNNAGAFYNVGSAMLGAIQSGISSQAGNFTGFMHDVIINAINAILTGLGLPPISGNSGNSNIGPSSMGSTGLGIPRRPGSGAGNASGGSMSNIRNNYHQPVYNFGTMITVAGQGNGQNSIDRFRR